MGEGKYLFGKIRKTEKENIWREKIFGLQRKITDEKEKEDIIWKRKIKGDANQPTKLGEYSAICLLEGYKIEGRDLQYTKVHCY